MGFLANYKKKRAEEKAFKQIIAPKIASAERQEYAKEVIKVARERGRAKARQPSSNILSGIVSFVSSGTSPKPQSKKRRVGVYRTNPKPQIQQPSYFTSRDAQNLF